MKKTTTSLSKYYYVKDLSNISKTGVYAIKHNNYKNKYYVGSTGMMRKSGIINQGFCLRWRLHIHELKHNKHPNKQLQDIANKYGLDGFKFFILEVVESNNKKLAIREQFWMDKLKSVEVGFNLLPFARSSFGKSVGFNGTGSKSVCQYSILGELIASYPSAREASRKTSISYKHISNCCKGKYGRCLSGGFVWRFFGDNFEKYPLPKIDVSVKKIKQYTLDDVYIKTWDSISQAAGFYNLSIGNLSMCIHGKRNKSGGYKWKI